MDFIKKFLLLVLAFVVGLGMMKYREKMVRMVGKNYYAEKYLGPGGSYTFWVIFGVFVIAFTLYYVFR